MTQSAPARALPKGDLNDASRLHLKLFIAEGAPEPEVLVPLWHQWIRDAALGEDELLIDVADYAHVHHGPAIALIGHGVDVFYDLGDGRPGLLLNRKRGIEGTLSDRIENGLALLRRCAARLESEIEGLRFGQELALRVVDRLHARNDQADYEALVALAKPLLAAAEFSTEVQREERLDGPLALLAKDHLAGE